MPPGLPSELPPWSFEPQEDLINLNTPPPSAAAALANQQPQLLQLPTPSGGGACSLSAPVTPSNGQATTDERHHYHNTDINSTSE